MDTTQFTPQQMNRLRRAFKLLNMLMVFMWKIGLGKWMNAWPQATGQFMLIRHTGRKSGRARLAPVNFARVDGDVYCTAGFGALSDWYRNILKNPHVELWLPEGRFQARALDVSDSPRRAELLRAVLVGAGPAAPFFGVDPKKLSAAELLKKTSDYRIIRFDL